MQCSCLSLQRREFKHRCGHESLRRTSTRTVCAGAAIVPSHDAPGVPCVRACLRRGTYLLRTAWFYLSGSQTQTAMRSVLCLAQHRSALSMPRSSPHSSSHKPEESDGHFCWSGSPPAHAYTHVCACTQTHSMHISTHTCCILTQISRNVWLSLNGE